MNRHSIFQKKFIASIYPNGTVWANLDMTFGDKVKIVIKKKKGYKEKELKLKYLLIRACIQGRPNPNLSVPGCLSKLVSITVNER